MSTERITNSLQLRNRLNELKQERRLHEDAIAKNLDTLYHRAHHPAPYLKELIHELATDKNVKKDLLKTALHFAANYAVDHYVYKSADTFLAALLDKLKERAGGGRNDEIIGSLLRFFSGK